MKRETLERFLSSPVYQDGGILYTNDAKQYADKKGNIRIKAHGYKFHKWKIEGTKINIGNYTFEISNVHAIGKAWRKYPKRTRLSTNHKPTTH